MDATGTSPDASTVLSVKLDPALADRILESARSRLPTELPVTRCGRTSVRVRTKRPGISLRYGSAAVFGHVSRSAAALVAVSDAFAKLLDLINDALRMDDLTWPGLDFGPTTIEVQTVGRRVTATITDRSGSVIEFPAINLALTEPNPDRAAHLSSRCQ